MAGIEVDLAALDQLERWMRDKGASYARVGDYELRLEGSKQVVVPAVDVEPGDPDAALRSELQTLLLSSSADPEAFLAAMKRRA